MKSLMRQGTTALRSCFMLVFALCVPQAVLAQEDRGTIEEIIVTGTKRDESAQDVPIALTAVSEEMLQGQFRTDVAALGEMTPGLALGQTAGFRAIAGGIRGTGQNSILVTQDSSVVILVDEFGLANVQSQFVEMFDIDRVEIYRGPQGTLFGKSATGGAISITSKRPVMNEYFADVEVQYGQFNGSDGPKSDIEKYRFALNVPIIDDTLSVRLAAIWDEDEGYYTNDKATGDIQQGILAGIPLPPELDNPTQGSGENLNNTDVFASKVKVLWKPNDFYEAYFIWSHLDDDSGSPPGVNESEPAMLLPLLGFPSIQAAGHSDPLSTGVTNSCFGDAFCIPEGHRVDVDMYQLHQTLSFDNYTVKLLYGNREQEEILASTYTGEAYLSLFDASRNTTRDHEQYEVRVSSEFDGPFNFVAGFSYEEEEVKMLAFATVGLSGLFALDPDFVTDPAMTGASQDRETTAYFADFSYEFNDLWSISGGVRYTKDEKDFFRRQNPGGPCTALTPAKDERIIGGVCLDARSNATSRVGDGFTPRDLDPFKIPLPDSAFEIALRTGDDWDETTYRFAVERQLGEDGMAYFSYATGFISGGFTETCSTAVTCLPFESETNENFEFGYKGQFLDNTLQANFAIFFTEYEDLIRSQVVPFTNIFDVTTQETINVNAGVTDARGFETEIRWLPQENLEVGFFYGYLDHEYDEFDLNGADLSDLDVPFSPENKYGLSVTYEHEFMNGTLSWNTNFNHQDEAEFSVFNSPLTQLEERDLLDANVTYYDGQGRYRLTLWGKNLTDELHRSAANSVAGLWNFTMYDRPRSFGVELAFHFGD